MHMLSRIRAGSAELIGSAAVAAAALCLAPETHAQTRASDYPTLAVADYVVGCMKANGESRETLAACSCSVDVVSSILPYPRYEEASTFLSMMQMQGEGAGLFRETAQARAAIRDLRRAQAEADVRCFNSAS